MTAMRDVTEIQGPIPGEPPTVEERVTIRPGEITKKTFEFAAR